MPDRVTTLSGSCVTVPCSFTVGDEFRDGLTSECKTKWLKDGDDQPIGSTILKGSLTEYNCTTTFNNVHQDGGSYVFRIDCPLLKYSFGIRPVTIQIKVK